MSRIRFALSSGRALRHAEQAHDSEAIGLAHYVEYALTRAEWEELAAGEG